MRLNKEDLINKIKYRSSYRGTKEMDIMLSKFVNQIINNLNYDELLLLDNLVNLDDEEIISIINSNIPNSDKDNKIIKLLKSFQYFK
tara:strand:+ start:385 stop:645 length:261 start_codon:yes stop_codon:yes gene_type:complete